jgi:hypothetical protein
MNAPRRLLDDPDADAALRAALAGVPKARSLDAVTRRRLSAKVARASALPAVAAGWLFVKSAAAALGVVLGTGAIAVSTGVIQWTPTRSAPAPAPPAKAVRAPRVTAPALAPSAEPIEAPPESEAVEQQKLNPAPSLPLPSAVGSAAGTLSAEAALLEQARRQMRAAPEVALGIAQEHATRFPRAQLASERTLIQIEALHRLGRDPEARALASRLLDGASTGLYAERVRQLLGASAP